MSFIICRENGKNTVPCPLDRNLRIIFQKKQKKNRAVQNLNKKKNTKVNENIYCDKLKARSLE